MSDSNAPISQEFQELLTGLIDDKLTPEQSRRLAEIIQDNPEARAHYLEHCRMHATLAWEHGVLGGMSFPAEAEEDSKLIRTPFWRRWARPLAVAAGLVLAAGVIWTTVVPVVRKNAWNSSEVVGTVSRESGGQLSVRNLNIHLRQGDALHVGDYELIEGLAQIVLANKVQIIVEAPTEFSIKSSSLIELFAGRLSANVPPEGFGFTVETPNTEVVDFGTEFGVEVGSEKQSEVHVFKGAVRVTNRASSSTPVRLLADQATRVYPNTIEPVGINIAPERFMRSFDEPVRLYRNTVKDLNPVAYYRMAISDDGVTLIDKSDNGHHGRIERGTMVQSSFAPGRIGASLRLEGPKTHAYAMVHDYPKATENRISVAAWVYADSRPRYASIAKNWSLDEIGQFYFGLEYDQGGLVVQIREADGNTVKVVDPEPLPIGSWQHVAFVADGETLRIYRNGEEVANGAYSTLAIPTFPSLGIGAKLLGNEAVVERPTSGFWDGKIDELAIFNHALSPENIRQLNAAVSEQELYGDQ